MGEMSEYYADLDESLCPYTRYNFPKRDSFWNTREGRRIRIRDMEDEHLYNAAYLLMRRKHSPEWQRAFLDELQRRILTPEHFALNLSVDDLDCLVEALW